MIKYLERLWLVSLLFGLLWLAVPSTVFLRPVATLLDVDTGRVTFTRETPFGTVTARWRTEITLVGRDDFECNSGRWSIATYQQRAGDTVQYQIGEWANDCVEAGPPFIMRTVRQVLLFDVIPLRPDTDIVLVETIRTVGGQATQ